MKTEFKVLWLACLLVVGVAAVGAVAAPVASRYVDVEIEVFRSWGFLGLGAWEPLDARFLSMDIARLDPSDLAAVEKVVADCGEPSACGALGELRYTFQRRYAVQPVLGLPYRLVLTNRTAGLLGVVLAIDGLNTNGNAEVTGTSDDKKWILLPGQTVRIAGWQVSDDEALAFRFATPSQSHSSLEALRGTVRIDIYLPDPRGDVSKGTGAGAVIAQPTIPIPFAAATTLPVDVFEFTYARKSVSLGFLCEETDGSGIRISTVVAGTIAELRGLKAGDLVTYVNAIPVNTCADLAAYLATRRPGDRVVLKVHREGGAFLLTLELEE